jgi:hypothetical protein
MIFGGPSIGPLAFMALPPHFPAAALHYILWFEIAVLSGMPLFS